MAKIKLNAVLGLLLALVQAVPAIVQAVEALKKRPPAG